MNFTLGYHPIICLSIEVDYPTAALYTAVLDTEQEVSTLPIIKINPVDFGLFDWPAVRKHIADQRLVIQTDVWLFTSSQENGWMADLHPDGQRHKSALSIPCQFWLDPHSRRKRPRLTDPDRTAYITQRERRFLGEFLRTITMQPWLNLKVVWLPKELEGTITVHFKVYDYEPFLKEKTTAPN